MKRVLATLLLAAPLMTAAAEPKLPDLKLTYSAEWRGIGLGTMTVRLKPGEERDCYLYISTSNPSALVRAFIGSPREESRFCVKGGKVVPNHFESTAEDVKLDFDMKALKVTDDKGEVRDIKAIAVDHFAIQQAVRLWVLKAKDRKDPGTVEFQSVEKKKLNVYRFAITGRDEEIEVPAGKFRTLRVERVDNPNRQSVYWIAPERDWMPVKVMQARRGTTDLQMELREPANVTSAEPETK